MKPSDVHPSHKVYDEGWIVSDPVCVNCRAYVYETPDLLLSPCKGLETEKTNGKRTGCAVIDWTKPIQTVYGLAARVICTDRVFKDRPVVVLVKRDTGSEFFHSVTLDGKNYVGEQYVVNVPEENVFTRWLKTGSNYYAASVVPYAVYPYAVDFTYVDGVLISVVRNPDKDWKDDA